MKQLSPLGFWVTNGSPSLGQTIRPYNNQQEQKLAVKNFAVAADHKVKLKEKRKER